MLIIGDYKVKVKSLSRVRLFETPWTVTYQVPLSMGFSRQEFWSGLPFPSPGDLSNPGIEPRSPALQADSLPAEPQGKPFVLKYIRICRESAKGLHKILKAVSRRFRNACRNTKPYRRSFLYRRRTFDRYFPASNSFSICR